MSTMGGGVLQQEMPPKPHVVEEEHVLLPAHLEVESTSDTLPSATSASASSNTPFEPAPWPYSASDPPCTSYARQDNCVGDPPLSPDPLPACGGFSEPLPANTSAFVVLGDYGLDGNCESEVQQLIMKLEKQFGRLDFIMTTGDNGYWGGNCASYVQSVRGYYSSFLPNNGSFPCTDPMTAAAARRVRLKKGREFVNPHWQDMQHFHEKHEKEHRATMGNKNAANSLYIHDMNAANSESLSSTRPRFYPSMGNHDWDTFHLDPLHMPYFQFFPYIMDLEPSQLAHGSFFKVSPAPGLELYSLNSNLGTPAATVDEKALFQKQADWLQQELMHSNASFKIVYFHHPPFCTAQHDALAAWMDLPFEDWGASIVIAGHEHVYERLLMNRARADGSAPSMPYIVNGLGGHPWTYTIDGCPAYPGSQLRYNTYHGAQLAVKSWDEEQQKEKIDWCFYSVEDGGKLIDQFELWQE